jgi:restriction endonuclease S subunit
MVKSMVEHLDATQSLDAPRKLRFSEQFTDDVTTLVTVITSDIISRYNKDTKVISCSSNISKLCT